MRGTLWCTSKQVSSLHKESGTAIEGSEMERKTHSRELV